MEQERLPRQIVVCCDGTNGTLTGGQEDTNVVLLHNHVAGQPEQPGVRRLLYYDPGVGSPGVLPPTGPVELMTRSWDRMMGLASGEGVYDNIAQAYQFLMRHWRDDADRIYLFGFSRGSFTVRAVAGMVNLFGIVRPEYEALVPTLVHIYFTPPDESRGTYVQRTTRALHRLATRRIVGRRDALAEEVRQDFAGPGRRDAWVHWIGVWDTVESVGLPGPLSRVNPTPPTVHDKRYRNVRHALCLDEHRWAFLPRLYEEPADLPAPRAHAHAGRTLKQRWYPGAHTDVGGGYAQGRNGIADASLRWMVDEVAPDLGIGPIPPAQAQAWIHDPLYGNAFWALMGMTVRRMHPERPAGFQAIAADNLPGGPIGGDWNDGPYRSVGWFLAAVVVGLALLTASGIALIGDGAADSSGAWSACVASWRAAQGFADLQLASLGLGGLIAPGSRPWELAGHPGWAMFWDLPFIACWGYVVGRITSRSFAWLVGRRSVDSARPWWLWLGFAPMLAVMGDAGEDLALWSALALHWAGTDALALLALWLGGLGSLLKFVGLAGCAPLVAVRCVAWRRRRP
jgi:uncharacterized protein (DUF2235 family)